jgi:lipoate-protein ligase A
MRATTLEKQTDQRITWKKLAHAIVCGFENALQIEIKIGRLSDQERKRAKQLLEEKYANMDWTRRL